MSPRLSVALAYGVSAAVIALCLTAQPALALNQPDASAIVAMDEIVPGLTGHAELDDLPAYLTEAEQPGPEVVSLPASGPAGAPSLRFAAAIPDGLSPALLGGLALLGIGGLAWVLARRPA